MLDPKDLSPALGAGLRDDFAPAIARPADWQAYSIIPPFAVPEPALQLWFDTGRCMTPGYAMWHLRSHVAYYVNVIRFYMADPETCCANFGSWGTSARLDPDEVRELGEWGLLERILSFRYPANFHGPCPYVAAPMGKQPLVIAPWVRVPVEDWVPPPRMAFPGRVAMRKLPVETLVWLAGEAIAEDRRSNQYGKRSYRRLNKVLDNLLAEFEVRGLAAKMQLIGLVEHVDPHVRIAGGLIALALGEPERGLPALRALADDTGLQAHYYARSTLEGWEQAKGDWPRGLQYL